jgi:hypothetical protein
MWAAEAWAKQQPDEPKCWDQSRDQHGEKDQTSDVFFNDILHGTMCESNWYEVSLRPPTYLGAPTDRSRGRSEGD